MLLFLILKKVWKLFPLAREMSFFVKIKIKKVLETNESLREKLKFYVPDILDGFADEEFSFFTLNNQTYINYNNYNN